MERFSDFATEEVGLAGKKLKIEDVLNVEIVVVGYRVLQSKFNDTGDPAEEKKCLQLQIEKDGERHIVFSGSTVLTRQVEQYRNHIPFQTTIQKIDRYFTFT